MTQTFGAEIQVDEKIIYKAYLENDSNAFNTATALGLSLPVVYKFVKLEQEAIQKSKMEQEENKKLEEPKVKLPVRDLDFKPIEYKYPQEIFKLIPDPKDDDLKNYNPRSFYAKFKALLKGKFPVLLIGSAGTGKTSVCKYYARERNLPFLEVSCDNLLGFREMFGQINITDGKSHFVEGLFSKISQHPSVILLDEINALDPGKNFMLHQLLNSREFFVKESNRGEGRTYRLHPDCKVILACNPTNGMYSGTNRINIALLDRLVIIEVKELSKPEIEKVIPDFEHKNNLIEFYVQIREVIKKENVKVVFSLRTVFKIIECLELGFDIGDAIKVSFLNSVKISGGDSTYQACYGITQTIFKV